MVNIEASVSKVSDTDIIPMYVSAPTWMLVPRRLVTERAQAPEGGAGRGVGEGEVEGTAPERIRCKDHIIVAAAEVATRSLVKELEKASGKPIRSLTVQLMCSSGGSAEAPHETDGWPANVWLQKVSAVHFGGADPAAQQPRRASLAGRRRPLAHGNSLWGGHDKPARPRQWPAGGVTAVCRGDFCGYDSDEEERVMAMEEDGTTPPQEQTAGFERGPGLHSIPYKSIVAARTEGSHEEQVSGGRLICDIQ
jgi:hypothetical protein